MTVHAPAERPRILAKLADRPGLTASARGVRIAAATRSSGAYGMTVLSCPAPCTGRG